MGLTVNDHRCRGLFLRYPAPLTAQVGLTTGVATGAVDQLERAGYVLRRLGDGAQAHLPFDQPGRVRASLQAGVERCSLPIGRIKPPRRRYADHQDSGM